ncbi:MAG: GNAT family N-acetyltransferase [Anaerolineae bacterium]|nr:GNAT family N-acetyltransferase [Anaerolineae bacterium]
MAQLEPELRVISPDEAPAVVTLMRKIGWMYAVEQTQHNITLGGQGSFCLAFDKEIVATALALKYSSRLAWVGMVISDPAYQRRGFARRLMNHVMGYLSDVESVMLDASTLGFPLYDSMGYQSLYKIYVYSGAANHFTPADNIRPMTVADLPTVIDMDSLIMGLARPQVITWLFEVGEGYVVTDSGKITGYMFTRTQVAALRMVAWNAANQFAAESLLEFASTLAAQAGLALETLTPEPSQAAREIAERHGLTIERALTRMVYGKQPPGHMSEQYGIIAFMTG